MADDDSALPIKRMAASDRREQVLVAASRAFARGGYAGTSTDAVAKEAGVSQPYVVRMFGTKVDLFHEVFARSIDAIWSAFGSALDDLPEFDPANQEHWAELGMAYSRLLDDRDLLMVLMHGFTQGGSVPDIGAQARAGMSAIYRLITRRTQCTPDQARDFLAHGMLINTLLSMQAPEHADEDPALAELTVCTFSG